MKERVFKIRSFVYDSDDATQAAELTTDGCRLDGMETIEAGSLRELQVLELTGGQVRKYSFFGRGASEVYQSFTKLLDGQK